jgi:hypothetical protein
MGMKGQAGGRDGSFLFKIRMRKDVEEKQCVDREKRELLERNGG